MSTILSVFLVLPWWLKILVLIIVIGIPMSIIEMVCEKIGGITGKAKIAEQTNSDPKLAVQTAVKSLKSGAFTLNDYESHLISIVEKTDCIDAMVKLIELYEGKQYGSKKDAEKCNFWRKRAAKSGDLNSIMDYYGFSDYDISSDSYDEILCDLKNVRLNAKDEEVIVNYYRGIVYYKIGQINMAKEMFTSKSNFSDSVISDGYKYMFFKCLLKEKNMEEAKKISDELVSREFNVPAEDYLALYNYYYTEKEATKENNENAFLFAVRYSAAENADDNVTNEISGNIFYRVAVSCRDGINGYDKDMKKCTESYIMAAKVGHVDAMGYVGIHMWVGKRDEIDIYREYHQANTYLLRAAQQGHEESQKILEQYGVDGILVAPMHAESITYQFMDGYRLTASAENMKWIQLYAGISYKVFQISDEFMAIYHNTFKTFDKLINGIYEVYAEQVAKMLRWGVQLLMFFNIDMYSANEILDECEDLSLFSRVPEFEHRLEIIDSRAAELNLKTAYAQASRGKWSGVGFGTTIRSTINASVQASVAAGVMNIGSSILHGIGDSIAESINNSEIKNMGKKLFEDPATFKEFNRALVSACFDVGCVIRKIIVNHCGIALSELDGSIKFGSEELANIDGKTLNAKIVNNLSAKRLEYTYALVIEKLRRFPTDAEVLEQLFMLTFYRISSLGADSTEIDILDRYASDANLDLAEFKNKLLEQLQKDRPELFV